MKYAKIYVASQQRLLPLTGDAGVIIPGTPGGGPGDGGDPVGDRTAILWGNCPQNLSGSDFAAKDAAYGPLTIRRSYQPAAAEIGRASCRERV